MADVGADPYDDKGSNHGPIIISLLMLSTTTVSHVPLKLISPATQLSLSIPWTQYLSRCVQVKRVLAFSSFEVNSNL